MRFQFCRNIDCPDWLLAEILTLSRIKSSTLKELCSLVASSICGEDLNYEYVRQLLSDIDFDESLVQACTASLRWILSNAAGALIDAPILDSELQQLGLPKEQSEALRDAFHEQKDAMKEALKQQTFKASASVDWSYDIKGIEIGAEKEAVVQVRLEGDLLDQNEGFQLQPASSLPSQEARQEVSFCVTEEQLGALIHECETAYKHMNEIKPY